MLPNDMRNNSRSEDWEFILSLYERFQRLMYRTAVQFLPQDAEDVIHDALIRLCRPQTVETLRTLNTPMQATYIVRTVSSVAKNQLKRRSKSLPFSSEAEPNEIDVPDPSFSPEALMLLRERADEFYRCFQELNETDQFLLRGKYILELSDSELAKALGCKPSSIRMKLTRARRKALTLLQKGAYFSEQN